VATGDCQLGTEKGQSGCSAGPHSLSRFAARWLATGWPLVVGFWAQVEPQGATRWAGDNNLDNQLEKSRAGRKTEELTKRQTGGPQSEAEGEDAERMCVGRLRPETRAQTACAAGLAPSWRGSSGELGPVGPVERLGATWGGRPAPSMRRASGAKERDLRRRRVGWLDEAGST